MNLMEHFSTYLVKLKCLFHSPEFDQNIIPRALDMNDVETNDESNKDDDDDVDSDMDQDNLNPPWVPEPRSRKKRTEKCRFPNTAAWAARRNSGDTEFTMWVNFVCMDLSPFFPGIGKKHALKNL